MPLLEDEYYYYWNPLPSARRIDTVSSHWVLRGKVMRWSGGICVRTAEASLDCCCCWCWNCCCRFGTYQVHVGLRGRLHRHRPSRPGWSLAMSRGSGLPYSYCLLFASKSYILFAHVWFAVGSLLLENAVNAMVVQSSEGYLWSSLLAACSKISDF